MQAMLGFITRLAITACIIWILWLDYRALFKRNQSQRTWVDKAAVYLSITAFLGLTLVSIVAIVSIIIAAVQHQYFGVGVLILLIIYILAGIAGGYAAVSMWHLLRTRPDTASDADAHLTNRQLAEIMASTKSTFIWLRLLYAAGLLGTVILVIRGELASGFLSGLIAAALIVADFKLHAFTQHRGKD
ncbi:hypothetical protein [Lacticaseibacillus hulanensis]|uniref:hypothetical protein n=1 Tax=Lacticaseibacillus hulanensis TaxID=2493111 RepID=UPI000FDCC29D|nr:hypothetical protein [Lacticaseibacillus hulanensis]